MKKLLPILTFLVVTLNSVAQNLQISGGNTFSLTICSNTNVYAWGDNGAGQVLGTSVSTTIISTPTLVNGLPSNIRQVDAGSGSHAVAVDCQGRVWTWGLDNCGQTGRGGAVLAGAACEGAGGQRFTGSVPGIGIGETYGASVLVSGGNNTTYAVISVTGQVLAWGQNNQGQLADGGTTNRSTPNYLLTAAGVRLSGIVQIEGGDNSSYALDRNGNVWSWGANSGGNKEAGRLPAGTDLLYAGLVQADYNNDGTADGPLQNIVQLSGGDSHGIAIDNQGRVWGWGGNWAQGQIGNGSNYQNSDFAKLVNAPNNSASTADRGVGPFIGDPGQPNAIFAAAGQASSAIVLDNGRVVTFGSNKKYGGTGCNFGTLGNGDNTSGGQSLFPQYVKTNATTTLTGIVSVSDGDGWYFAQDASGQFYTWGENAGGTLGDGTTTCSEYAKTITLPSGCAGYLPCPGIPNIGTDQVSCPNFSFSTNQLANSYIYTWQTRPTTVSGWSLVSSGSGISFSTASGTSIGQYRLLISDNRSLGVLCGTCPTVGDTVTFSPPVCSSNPNLGTDLQVCQPVNQVLNSGLTGSTLVYQWEYSAASSTTGFSTLSTGTGLTTILGSNLGFYRVSVINNTTCSGCIPTSTDVIRLTAAPSVFNAGPSSICTTVSGSGVFTITTTAGGGAYFWYTNPTGGVALNTVAGLSISGVSSAQTSTLSGCTGRVLYVQDQASILTTLLTASGTTTQLCGASGGNDDGNRSPMMIKVGAANVTLTSLDIVMPNFGFNKTFNYTVEVYSNNPTGGPYCGGCSPAGNTEGRGVLISSAVIPGIFKASGTPAAVQTITFPGFSLSSNTNYWIQVTGGESWWFNCNPATTISGAVQRWQNPINDISGSSLIQAQLATRDGGYAGSGHVFNMKFNAGNVSTCSRIPVCATATCPLSVSYADFYGVKNNSTVDLNWSTISEQNASHFIIERSNDGLNFTPIGTVKAKGNSNSVVKYSYNDPKPGRGTVYYRLVQYDFDNSYYVSKVISINSTVLNDFTVIPNPNNGNFTVNATLNSPTEFTLKVINSLGVTLSSSNEKTDGSFTKDFNLNTLAAGVYYISFKAGDDYIVKKVMIE